MTAGQLSKINSPNAQNSTTDKYKPSGFSTSNPDVGAGTNNLALVTPAQAILGVLTVQRQSKMVKKQID